jgi:hypothetical protein
MQWKVSFPNDA